MTSVDLLQVLKSETQKAISDIVMPTKPQEGDRGTTSRPADIHLTRLPKSESWKKKAPYIIHQVLAEKNTQPAGSEISSNVTVRSVFCVYNENEEEGGLMLLNLVERLRVYFMKKIILTKRYELSLNEGLEFMIYPDNTSPFYNGEMYTVWKIPKVQREVEFI